MWSLTFMLTLYAYAQIFKCLYKILKIKLSCSIIYQDFIQSEKLVIDYTIRITDDDPL